MPTPDLLPEEERLQEEEVEEYLDALNLVFGDRLLTLRQLKAIYWIYAYERLGTRREAGEALGIAPTTGWRFLREMGWHSYIRKQRRL
jgi:hypothetical protein